MLARARVCVFVGGYTIGEIYSKIFKAIHTAILGILCTHDGISKLEYY